MKDSIVAIVQARMTSTRLPGKVMKDILGKPMLGHLIERLKISKLINDIVIATPKKNNPIIKLTHEYLVKSFMGSEYDVLDRYFQAAKLYQASVIVRITADCPLIDPQIVDRVIKYYLDSKRKLDYVSNALIRSYPRGLDTEVFSFNSLETAWRQARESYQREHVTPYIYENPKRFRLGNVKSKIDLSYMRWTVDEERDLQFVREIYKRLYKNGEIFLMDDIVALLKKEPELMAINKGVEQKYWRI